MDLDNLLDFDLFGRYEFPRCESCDGPLLGPLEVKCSGKDKVRYRSEAVRLFESWLKRIKGFREAVIAKQAMKAGKFAEALKIVLENKESKFKTETTT